jgi:hypothetical protein
MTQATAPILDSTYLVLRLCGGIPVKADTAS